MTPPKDYVEEEYTPLEELAIRADVEEKALVSTIIGVCCALACAVLLFGCSTKAYADVVQIAIAEIGKGEIGGNNKGEEVKKYTRGQEVPWCAGFVSYVLGKAGKKSPYFLSAKSFWNSNKSKRVAAPKSGDIICFYRGSRRDSKGHVGIVEKVDATYIHTIEGNTGAYPSKVKRFKYPKNNVPKLLGYVRVS